MKFNIYFTLRGPDGTVTIPNNTNPVTCPGIQEALTTLSLAIEDFTVEDFTVEVIGIRIEEAE